VSKRDFRRLDLFEGELTHLFPYDLLFPSGNGVAVKRFLTLIPVATVAILVTLLLGWFSFQVWDSLAYYGDNLCFTLNNFYIVFGTNTIKSEAASTMY
jgi:hypothetical protein